MHEVIAVVALIVAVCAMVMAWRASRLAASASSIEEWERAMARLSEDLLLTAEQVSAHLDHQSDELEALLDRAERMRDALRALSEDRIEEPVLDEVQISPEVMKLETAEEPHAPPSMDQRIREMLAQGKSVRDIARQMQVAQEEVALRLKISAQEA